MNKEIEQISLKIICPFCNRSISEIWMAKMDSVIGIRYAYICSKCYNLLKLSKERFSEKSINSFLAIKE